MGYYLQFLSGKKIRPYLKPESERDRSPPVATCLFVKEKLHDALRFIADSILNNGDGAFWLTKNSAELICSNIAIVFITCKDQSPVASYSSIYISSNALGLFDSIGHTVPKDCTYNNSEIAIVPTRKYWFYQSSAAVRYGFILFAFAVLLTFLKGILEYARIRCGLVHCCESQRVDRRSR